MAGYFIGWDVGGWNCDTNPKSRDAIVILDTKLNLVGKPWRGNLREVINSGESALDFIGSLVTYCSAKNAESGISTLIAIDTPLGFSLPFIDLLTAGSTASSVGKAATNPYLHRQTEFFLFEHGLSPLSPLKDMIGSQATKGLHVLNRYGFKRTSCGVWENEHNMTAIESYPSACKRSALMKSLVARVMQREPSDSFPHQDHKDALICALTGWLFRFRPETLVTPSEHVDPMEGWIFAPADGMNN
ncbi:hypothetical protein [Pectobacterium versatile]|uniref:hypothetical protein n=1 Tax=Pectobacterium versatile TaxID=2488639 RepID=UPI0030166158